MNYRPSPQDAKGNAPMIVWDGLGLSAEHSGIGVYGEKLYHALSKLGCEPNVVSFADETISYVPRARKIQISNTKHAWLDRIRHLKPFYPLFTYQARMKIWSDQPVVFHGLSNINLPFAFRKKVADRFVISVHDLIPLQINPTSPLTLQLKFLLPRVLARADKIITVSNWTKIQLMERYGLKLGEKIEIVANGTVYPSKPVFPWSERNLEALTISRGEDYKRLDFVVNMARCRPDRQFTLVTDETGKKILGPVSPNLRVLTRLTQDEIEQLYSRAKILVHPSLYEGWCLPAADAIARGLYVLHCSGSGIDEVASYAKDQCIGLTREAKFDEWLAAFDEILEKGEPHATSRRLPAWSEIALKTLQIYRSLI